MAGGGLEIVGIAFEREPEETARATVRQFVDERKANYPILFGGQERRTHVLATIKGIERFQGYPRRSSSAETGPSKR